MGIKILPKESQLFKLKLLSKRFSKKKKTTTSLPGKAARRNIALFRMTPQGWFETKGDSIQTETIAFILSVQTFGEWRGEEKPPAFSSPFFSTPPPPALARCDLLALGVSADSRRLRPVPPLERRSPPSTPSPRLGEYLRGS